MIHLWRHCIMAVPVITAALAVSSAGAQAGAPTPICRLPTVIERMTAALRLNPHYALLDRVLISE